MNSKANTLLHIIILFEQILTNLKNVKQSIDKYTLVYKQDIT